MSERISLLLFPVTKVTNTEWKWQWNIAGRAGRHSLSSESRHWEVISGKLAHTVFQGYSPKEWEASEALRVNRATPNFKPNPKFASVQLSSVTQSRPTLCNPMNRSTPGLPVRHQLPEFTQTHVHRVPDAIQPSHPRLSPSPPVSNPSQHQILFQWVNSSHEVAKVLEFQL